MEHQTDESEMEQIETTENDNSHKDCKCISIAKDIAAEGMSSYKNNSWIYQENNLPIGTVNVNHSANCPNNHIKFVRYEQ